MAKLSFASRWTVFGPVDRKSAVPATAQLGCVPKTLTIDGKRLVPRTVAARKGVLDLAPLIGGTKAERTAYVFISISAPETGEFRLGIGADWWFEAWIDGKPVGNTLEIGNGFHPTSKEDHEMKVNLAKGAHVLVVRFISGSATSILAVGTPTLTQTEKENLQYRRNIGATTGVVRPLKIVFLGAGSGFLQPLFTDILNIPGADRGEMALVDINPERLHLADQLCRKIEGKMGRNWKITILSI